MADRIVQVMLKLGIRSTYQGFYYLNKALKLCLENEDYLLSICKNLYADVAKIYNSNRENVEHCIRTIVSNCWYHGNREFLIEMAGYPLNQKPTNSEFIDILYHYLKS